MCCTLVRLCGVARLCVLRFGVGIITCSRYDAPPLTTPTVQGTVHCGESDSGAPRTSVLPAFFAFAAVHSDCQQTAV